MSDTSDSGDTPDPTEIRDEVQQELKDLTEEASDEEVERMAERDRAGVDEPNDEANQSTS